MDRKSLLKMMIGNGNNFLVLLMLAFCFFALPPAAKAQQPFVQCEPGAFYYGDLNPGTVQIGTDCSRLAAIITETDNGVTFTVCGVAPFIFDVVEFGVYYDPAKYFLSDPTFTEKIDCYGLLNSCGSSFSNAITIGDVLSTNFIIATNTKHLEACDEISFDCNPMENKKSPVKGMAAFSAELALDDMEHMPPYEYSIEGGMVDLFTFYLKKVNPGALDISTDIGIGAFANIGIGFGPLWMYSAGSVTYYEGNSAETEYVKGSALFLFRAPASIKAVSAATAGLQATLTGHYDRMSRPITTGILDGVDEDFEVLSTNGRLNWDNITRYGFIYAEDRAVTSLTIDKYSRRLIINGAQADCDFPTQTSGSFSCTANGTPYTFYIVEGTNATLTDPSDDYTCQVTGEEGIEYRAWPFLTYTFESSSEFALVGDLLDFEVKDEPVICNISVGTIQVITPPDCNGHYGTIRVYADGATNYEYSLDGIEWKPFSISNSNYTNISLYAGTYRVYVRDADETACVVISEPVTLENSNSDLRITTSATMASTCTDEDGQIAFTVTGGTTQYSYTLTKDGVTKQPAPTASPITDLGTGVYILTVTDGQGCTASSGEIRINSKAGLGVTRSAISHTTCGDATGSFALTINPGSAAPYTYQIDGGAVLSTTETTIMAANLSAGNHVWWVRDAEGCYAEGREVITNFGNDAFTVEVMTTDVPCGSNDGSITLMVTGGTPDFSYDFGEGTQPFATGSRTITFAAPQGVYDIIITNDAGCSYEYQNAVVGKTTYSDLVGTITVNNQPEDNCGVSKTGSVKVVVSGGSGSYNYDVYKEGVSVKSGQLPVTGIIDGLAAGNYTITIADAGGEACSDITQTIALIGRDAQLVVSQIDPTAAADCDAEGSVSISFTGTYTDWKYSIDGAAGVAITGNPMNISASVGDHEITLIDPNNCVVPGGRFTIGAVVFTAEFEVTAVAPGLCDGTEGLIGIEIISGTVDHYCLDESPWITFTGTYKGVPAPAGNHTIKLKSGNCISEPQEVIIINNDPDAFTATAASSTPTSCGLNNGTITLTINGTAGDYYYSWDGSVPGNRFTTTTNPGTYIITDLAPGSYEITISNDAGCEFRTYNTEVHQGLTDGIIAGTINVNAQPTCGNDDGSIKVVATGASSYEYSMDGLVYTALPSNGIIDNLSAGHYTVTVRATGSDCSDISQTLALVNSNAATIVATIASEDATNCNSNDGIVTFTVTGSMTYEYKIDNGTYTSSTAASVTEENLAVGDHTITIKDANGCENPGGAFTIRAKTTDFDFSLTEEAQGTCAGGKGLLRITYTGAASEYSLNGGKWLALRSSPMDIAVLAGTHEIKLRDAAGCIALPKEVEITNAGSDLEASVTATTATSCGQFNGRIILEIRGGTAPYSYSLDGGKTFSALSGTANPYTINDLSAGIYDIKVRGTDNCSTNLYNAEIRQGSNDPVIAGTINVNAQPTCGNEDGSIKVVATGASSYEYSMDGLVYTALPSNGIIENLSAGHYTVIVRAAGSDCSDISQTLALVNSDALTVVGTITTTDSDNCTVANGRVTFTVIGAMPYEYKIDNGTYTSSTAVSVTVENLAVGDHTITIKDASGCENPGGSFTIRAKESDITFSLAAQTQGTCQGANGSLRITVTAGTATDYCLNGGKWIPMSGTTVDISVPAGPQTIELRDAAGCVTLPKEVMITNGGSDLAASVTATTATSCGEFNGTITMNITGTSTPFSYSFDGGVNYEVLTGSSPFTISGLSAGFYDIKIRDNSGCSTNSYNVEIRQGSSEPVIAGTINVNAQPTCGNDDGSIKVVATGASSYEYSMDGLVYTALPSNGIIDNLSAGHYTVTVRATGSDCSDISQTLALVNSNAATIVATIASEDATNCNSNDGIVTFTVTGSMTYEYKIDNGTYTSSTAASVTEENLAVGDHTITIKDANGCENPGGAFTIRAKTTDFDFSLTEEAQGTCAGGKGLLRITYTGAASEYSLNGGKWLALRSSPMDIAVLAGTHEIKLRDAAGCIALPKEVEITNAGSDLEASVTATTATSCGQFNGRIILEIRGGTAPYSYSLDGGKTFSALSGTANPYTINDLSAGIYDIKVRGTDNCSTNLYNAEIRQGSNDPVIAGTINVNAQPTCGNEDGSIKVVATGASSYEYSMDGLVYTALPSNGIIENLSAGHYTVIVRAAGSDCSDISQTLALVNSDALTVVGTITTTDSDNCTVANGRVTFTVIGAMPYEYKIDNGTYTSSTAVSVTVENLAVGDHTITIKDASGCENPGGSFTIRAKESDITFSLAAQTQGTCQGANGSLRITVTAGTATDYCLNGGKWIPMSGTTVDISVPAGPQTIELRDAAGCVTLPKEVMITNGGSDLAASVTATTATSCGEFNGTITMNITGTSTPFSYSFDGGVNYEVLTGSSPFTISGLSAGFYDIKIRDNSGCSTNSYNVEIRQGSSEPVIAGTINVNAQPTCGNDDGSIKVVATGASSYEYSMDGLVYTALPSNGIIDNLSAGHYTVTVRATGSDCSDISQTLALVNSNAATIVATIASEDATNCNSNDGIVTFTVTGSMTYEYKIDNGTYTSSTAASVTEENLAVGDHTITIKDANGCENPGGAFTIRAKTTDFDFSLTEEAQGTCAGGKGLLRITYTGAASEYSLNGGKWLALRSSPMDIAVLAGTHEIKLRDAAGCIALPKEVEITNAGSDLEASVTATTATSCGQFNGRIILEIRGGTAPYSYSLDGGKTFSALSGTANPYTINDLSAGIYDIKVRGTDNCSTNLYNAEIRQGSNDPVIAGTINVNAQPTCGNEDGSIKVVATGASSYEYSMDGLVYTALPSNGIIENLSAGHYTVIVRAAGSDCSDISQTLALVNSDALTVVGTITTTDSDNCTVANGRVTFTVIGAMPYEYKIDNGTYTSSTAVSVTVENLAVGDHTITIKDASGCENPGGSFTIRAKESDITFSLAAQTQGTCQGANGSLRITVTAGTATDYCLNGGKWIPMSGTTVDISVPAGPQTIELRDAAGCVTLPKEVMITNGGSDLAASVTATTATSCGEFNGTITMNITGTSTPFSYSFDGGVNYEVLTGSSPFTISGLSAGFYDIKIRDNSGCSTNSYNVEIRQGSSEPVIAGTINVNAQPTCGNDDGSIKVVATGASSYEYSMDGLVYTALPSNGIIDNLSAGHYTVTVRATGSDCSDISQTLALVNSNAATIVATIASEDATNCNSNDGIVTFTVTGSMTYEYKIDNGTYTSSTAASVTEENLAVGDHTITIKDANGCENPGGAFTIRAKTTDFDFSLTEEAQGTCAGGKGLLRITYTGAASEYSLNGGKWLALRSSPMDIAVLAGTHEIKLRDAAGCIALPKEVEITNAGSDLEASVTATTATSCGQFNGRIILEIRGGTAPYSYSLDGGKTFSALSGTANPYTINDLSAGIYDIKVRGTDNCSTNLYNAEIRQGSNDPVIAGTINVNAQPTCGNEDGSIKVVATGASSYEYSMDGLVYTALPSNGIIENLSAGHYTVIVRAAGSDCSDISQTLALVNSDALTVVGTITTTDSDNCTVANGRVTFTVIGAMPYEYKIDNGTYTSSTAVSVTVENLAVGDHTITIKDASGCENPGGSFTIRAKESDITFSLAAQTQGTCQGANGSLRITVTAGTATDYCLNGGKWIPMSGTTVDISVPAGPQTIELRDAAGCVTLPKEVMITNGGSDLAASVTATTATSCGEFNGTITMNITGTSTPFSYSFDGGVNYEVLTGSSPFTISGLSAGFYDIKIRDNSGCSTNSYNVEIRQGSSEPVIAGTINVNAQPTCGNDDGSIKVVATGASSYEYSMDGLVYTALPSNGIIDNLSAGHYTVTVRATGSDCSDISQTLALVNSNAATIVATIASEDATNCNSNDGIVTFTVTGSMTYEYKIDNGTYTSSTAASVTEENLAVGDHTITIKDANGCENPGGAFTIRAKTTDFDFSLTEEAQGTCAGGKGLLRITYTGAASEYSLNGGKWLALRSSPMDIAVLAGTHEIKLRDAAGCIALPKEVEITNAGSDLEASVTATTATSCGQFNGRIILEIRGGTAPYSYSLDGGKTFSALSGTANPYTINDLSAGIYDIKVRGTDNCSTNLYNAEIRQGSNDPVIAGTINVNAQPTCGNEDGSIKVVATGASSYEYSMDGLVYTALPSNGIIENLSAGHYTVIVRAAGSDCSDISQTLALVNSDALTVVGTITTTDSDNCTVANGRVTFTVIGAMPYEYKIDNGTYTSSTAVSVTVENLAVGDHTITIKDASGCENPGGSFTIRAKESDITFSLAAQTQGTCQGANGSLRITVTAGTATDYCLNGGKWIPMSGTTVDISVPAGPQTIELRDAAGCVTLPKEVMITNGGSDLAASVTATTATSCGEFNGTITMNITGTSTPFSYSFDGGVNYEVLTGSSPFTISGLSAGFYDIKIRDNSGCSTNSYNVEISQGLGGNIAPPRVTTPQTFCERATVANLQADGVGIIWYNESGNELLPTEVLTDGGIYYAVQRVNGCESTTRSAVKVIIDNNVFLDAPTLPGIFDICGTGSTLADIPTYGNTNIVWYDSFTGGTKYENPATVTLEDGKSYFAAQSGGGLCVSASRTEVVVTIGDITPVAPDMESPQQFCKGALVGNLAVPNNQIVWYSAAEGGEVLPLTMPLIDGGVYYAAQKAGDCESATRIAVTVELTQYLKPDAMGLICINGMQKLADLPIAGAGIVWYATEDSETPLPLSTAISVGATYWAAQTNGDCESERIAVTLTDDCYNPRGTIFPFVHIGDNDFDNQFITTVKLYSLPPESTLNKINYVRSKSQKLFETLVIYYDETTYIAGTPKYPGLIGFFNNPGNPILWSGINQSGATPNNTAVTDVNDRPMSPIGQFGFENVAAGKYVIEVARQGFLTRYGVVTVGADQYLGHREILAGDINGDLNINDKDLSVIVSKYSIYGQSNYKWPYDINGSSKVGSDDASIIRIYLGAYVGTIYEETYKFLRNDY